MSTEDNGTNGDFLKMVQPVLENMVKKHDNRVTVRSVVIAAGFIVTGVCGALLFLENRVHAETSDGIAVHESRIIALEQQVPQLRTEVFEGRQDVRALQDVIITNQRSERLSKPLVAPVMDAGR